jgi:hypothetical protein
MKMAALSQGLTGHLDCATLASHEQITTFNRISGLCSRIQITALNGTSGLYKLWPDHSTQQDSQVMQYLDRSQHSAGHPDNRTSGWWSHVQIKAIKRTSGSCITWTDHSIQQDIRVMQHVDRSQHQRNSSSTFNMNWSNFGILEFWDL